MNAFYAGKRQVYDAVNMIHDVISTANPCPDTDNFMFVGARNNKTQQVRC